MGEVLYAQPDGQPEEAGDAEYLGKVPGLDHGVPVEGVPFVRAAGIEMAGEQLGERPEERAGGDGEAPRSLTGSGLPARGR